MIQDKPTEMFMVQDADCHSLELMCRRIGGVAAIEISLVDTGDGKDLVIWLAREDARGLANFINKELA